MENYSNLMEPLFKMYLKPSETVHRNHSIFIFSVPWGSDSFSLWKADLLLKTAPRLSRVRDGECDENKLGRITDDFGKNKVLRAGRRPSSCVAHTWT